jgi:outer membrane protein assembly factor BamA
MAIGSVKIKGITFFENDDIKLFANLPSQMDTLNIDFQNIEVNEAAQRIQNLYTRHGFFDIQATVQINELLQKEILLQPGLRYKISLITFNLSEGGRIPNNVDQLITSFTPFYSDSIVQIDQLLLEQGLQTLGYLHPDVSSFSQIDSLRKKIQITFFLKANDLAILDTFKVQLKNQKNAPPPKSTPEYIQEFWPKPNNSVIHPSDIKLFHKRMLSTSLFRSVVIKDSLLENGNTQLLSIIRERPPGEYKGTLFYEQIFGIGASYSVGYKNLLGRFHSLSSELLAAQFKQSIAFKYAHPLFFKTDWRFESRLIANQQEEHLPEENDILEYRQEFAEQTTISRSFGNLKILGLIDTRHLKLNYQGDSSEIVLRDKEDQSQFRFKVEPSFRYRKTNKITHPTLGYILNLALGNGGLFQTNNRYSYVNSSVKGYIPMGKSFYWAGALAAGAFIHGADKIDNRLFYQGGFRTLRGYSPRSIFAKKILEIDKNGNEKRAESTAPQFFRINHEFRWVPKIWDKKLQFAQFTDYVWIKDLDYDFTTLNHGASGVGIRFNIAMLAFRIDYTLKKDYNNPFVPEPFSLSRFSLDLTQAI